MRIGSNILIGTTAGVLIILFQLIELYFRPTGQGAVFIHYTPMLLFMASIYVAVKRKRDSEGEGFIDFKTALQTGFVTAIFATLGFCIGWAIGIQFEDLNYGVRQMKAAGKTVQEMQKILLDMTSFVGIFKVVLFQGIMQLFMGFFVTMVVSLLLKRERKTVSNS